MPYQYKGGKKRPNRHRNPKADTKFNPADAKDSRREGKQPFRIIRQPHFTLRIMQAAPESVTEPKRKANLSSGLKIGIAGVLVLGLVLGGLALLNTGFYNGPFYCTAHNIHAVIVGGWNYETIQANCVTFAVTCNFVIYNVIVNEGQRVTLYRTHNKPGATYTDLLSDWECN